MAYVYTGDARYKSLRIQKTSGGGGTVYDETFSILDDIPHATNPLPSITPDDYARMTDAQARTRVSTFLAYLASLPQHIGLSTDVDLTVLANEAVTTNNTICDPMTDPGTGDGTT